MINIVDKKELSWICFLSFQIWNQISHLPILILTQLNLNNSAQESFHKEVKYDRLQVYTLRLSRTDDPGERSPE